MRNRTHPTLILVVAMFSIIALGAVAPAFAQLKFTGCLKSNGKVTRVAPGDIPSKPCKANQIEIMLSGTDKTDALMETDVELMNSVEDIEVEIADMQMVTDNIVIGNLRNTAIGVGALGGEQGGSDDNVAIGFAALRSNSGGGNVAIGVGALENSQNAGLNVGIGVDALKVVVGTGNVAIGVRALYQSLADSNTAIGAAALRANVFGKHNIAIGVSAGQDGGTDGDANIYIGNRGAVESNTMRIGNDSHFLGQRRTFIAGIFDADVGAGGASVFVNADGQLGTLASSRRFKMDIQSIDDASSGLMQLRPVMFRYKSRGNGSIPLEYGLIAEEVAAVYPDLVIRSKTGEVQSVQYHKVNAMLLNEVQKQHRKLQEQQKLIASLADRLEVLEGQPRRTVLMNK